MQVTEAITLFVSLLNAHLRSPEVWIQWKLAAAASVDDAGDPTNSRAHYVTCTFQGLLPLSSKQRTLV